MLDGPVQERRNAAELWHKLSRRNMLKAGGNAQHGKKPKSKSEGMFESEGCMHGSGQ